jgi:membrane fusion protein (multidrug efflux system)
MTTASLGEHPSRPHGDAIRQEPRSTQGPKRGRIKRYLFTILGLLVLIGVLAGLKGAQIATLIGFGEKMQAMGPPPETVSTTPATEQDWERTLTAVANVVSAKGVAVSNDAPGIVSRLHFDSGATVKQGQVLVELDSSVERAQLASARARQKLADTSLRRSQELISSGVIARSQVDTDEAAYATSRADEAGLIAQIERKTLRAPFAGKLGLREVNLGQYLAPGTRVTVIESTTSDYVDFTLPQENLGRLQVGMAVRVTEEAGAAASEVRFEAGAAASAGAAPSAAPPSVPAPLEGTITAVDTGVDPSTRSVKVRASLPSGAGRLRPGMFVRVSVVLPERSKVVVVPLTAIVRASYGDSVFLVEEKPGPDGKPRKFARQSFVQLGDARGDFVTVTKGVKPGEEVVSAGAFKLRNGAPIMIDNKSVPQTPSLAPRPENR